MQAGAQGLPPYVWWLLAALLALVAVTLAVLAALLVLGGHMAKRGEAATSGLASNSGAATPLTLSTSISGRAPALLVALLVLLALPLCSTCGLVALLWAVARG